MHRCFDKWIKLVLFAVLMLTSACSNLNYSPSKEQNLKRYEISLTQSLNKRLNPAGPNLLIYPLKANNLYNTVRIAYSTNAFEVSYYAQNEWADTPARLLFPLVIANMENTNLFSAVVSTGSSAISDLALDAELLTLIQKYQESSSKIILSVRIQLVDLRKRSIIGSETLTIEETAPSNDPYGAVVATNVAAGKLMEQMRNFVLQSI